MTICQVHLISLRYNYCFKNKLCIFYPSETFKFQQRMIYIVNLKLRIKLFQTYQSQYNLQLTPILNAGWVWKANDIYLVGHTVWLGCGHFSSPTILTQNFWSGVKVQNYTKTFQKKEKLFTLYSSILFFLWKNMRNLVIVVKEFYVVERKNTKFLGAGKTINKNWWNCWFIKESAKSVEDSYSSTQSKCRREWFFCVNVLTLYIHKYIHT